MSLIGNLIQFVGGTKARANQVNQNFADIKAVVNTSVVMTDLARTVTAGHTFSGDQLFSGKQRFQKRVTLGKATHVEDDAATFTDDYPNLFLAQLSPATPRASVMLAAKGDGSDAFAEVRLGILNGDDEFLPGFVLEATFPDPPALTNRVLALKDLAGPHTIMTVSAANAVTFPGTVTVTGALTLGAALAVPITIGATGLHIDASSSVALGTATVVAGAKVSIGGAVKFVADNTDDIGATGANRPRDLFLGRHLTMEGDITVALATSFANLRGRVALGQGAIAADHATVNGLPFMSTIAGTPTGTIANPSGYVAWAFEEATDKLWVNKGGGTWVSVTLT